MNDNDNDIDLEKVLTLLCYVPGAGFYKRCSIRNVDEIDRKKLFSLCLIDSTLESCRRTILGDRLILEFVRCWDNSYPKPYFKEQPFGTLLEFLERDKDFNERYKRLIQERSGEYSTAQPNRERTDAAEQTQPRAGSDSSEEKTRENFKFPDDPEKQIDLLSNILQDLKNGKYQNKISEKYGFDPSLWHKGGENAGIGKYLPALRKRANEYKNDNKTRLIRRAAGDDTDSIESADNNDYLFCAHLLGVIDEMELDPRKDVNRREVPMGILGERGKWEQEEES